MPTPQSTLKGTSCDFKKLKPKSAVVQQAWKDGQLVHFASLMDLYHLKNSELAKHVQNTKGELCSRERTSKTMYTEQYSRSKEHQRRSWQRQHSWLHIYRLHGMAGEGQRRGISLQAGAHVRSHQIIATAKGGVLTSDAEGDGNHGTRLKNQCFFDRNLYGRPLAGLLWERSRRTISRTQLDRKCG